MDIYEQRPFIGGKVASYKDRAGNHVEMGLHVFFGCALPIMFASRIAECCCLCISIQFRQGLHMFSGWALPAELTVCQRKTACLLL